MEMDNLRFELFRITENGDPSSHPRFIEKLRAKIPHTIKVLESLLNINKYTCIMFALNISTDDRYDKLALICPKNVFANPSFVHFLIDKGYLLPLTKCHRDCLTVYFEEGIVKHIGKSFNDTRIVSKWGTGHLYEHSLFEVPSNMGSDVKYFSSINCDDTIKYFVEFAKSRGVELKSYNY